MDDSASTRRTRVISILATFCLVAGMLAVLAPGASAGERECKAKNVTQGTAKSSDLQAVIDAAEPGNTIKVKGTCIGNFIVTRDLTLVGKANKTTLDGNGSGTVLSVASGEIEWPAGFRAEVTLSSLLITGGNAHSGGGIYNEGDLTVSGVEVSGNTASDGGGGIYSEGDSLVISDSTVRHNEADRYGGGLAVWGGTVELSASDVSGNTAHVHAGGFWGHNADVSLDSTSVTGNYSGCGAGMGFDGDGSVESIVTMIDSEVNGNTDLEGPICDPGPAGIGTNFVTLTLINSTVNGNEGGPGLSNGRDGQVALIGSQVSGNDSTGLGVGGIRNLGILTLTDSVVRANKGTNGGGGVHNVGILTLIDSEVSGNTAFQHHPDIDPGGGGVFNWDAFWGVEHVLTLAGSSIVTGNTATFEGGGIYSEGEPTTQAADGTDQYKDPITGDTLPAWTGSVTGNSPDQCFPPLTLGGTTCGP